MDFIMKYFNIFILINSIICFYIFNKIIFSKKDFYRKKKYAIFILLIILIISLNIYYDQNLNYSKSQIGIRTIIINNTQFFLKQKNLNYVGFNIDYFKEKNKFSVFYFEEKGLNIYEFILNEKFEIVNFYHKKEIHKDLSFRDKLYFITKLELEKLGYHSNDFKFGYSKNGDLINVKYIKEEDLYSVEFFLDYNFNINNVNVNGVLQKYDFKL